ncbi:MULTISPECIES: hypothetical protein [unclassified Streptomyces]|uniref:hypothetical protein n=1 Tax=unclassified Streptomyces TaxID=2593676 RepID=UPI0036EA84A5
MTLEELVSRLAEADDGLTVFAAEPWTAQSDATAVPDPGGPSRPDTEGRTYPYQYPDEEPPLPP